MSITISNCSQVCNSPTNNSKSKMLYTFTKQNRFSKRKQILCDKFYNPKAISHARFTSFGFGEKYDFTRDASCSPPPNTYNLNDQFSSSPKKGFGFGQGRQEMQVTGPFVTSKKNKNPGPGSYQLPSMLQKGTFCFRSKLNTYDSAKKYIPGPGSYPVSFSINQKGRYFLAKYKSSCVRDFSKSQGRSYTVTNRVPGPGSYTTSAVDLSPKGKYINSKMNNCLVRKFGTSQRGSLADRSNTPGPGNYKLPSQFGYYQTGKKFHSRTESNIVQMTSSPGNKQNCVQPTS